MDFFKKYSRTYKRSRRASSEEIAPDEIFLDSSNLPQFDTHQFEGRIEKPISRRVIIGAGFFFLCIGLLYGYKVWSLQIKQGQAFAIRSQDNSLQDTVVFSDRGVIYDRNGKLLAWNIDNPQNPDFPLRKYATTTGLANIIGYVKYPSKDKSGFYYREDYVGMDGIEKYFNDELQGENGTKITETNSGGSVVSESVMNPPKSGDNLYLSLDSRIQSAIYQNIQDMANRIGFTGGAGIIMNVHNGEVIADVSYPEYNSQVMTDGTDTAEIQHFLTDKSTPLLNRVANGLYTPGSIVKPIMGLAALDTHTISANKVLYTNGEISVKSPYDPKVVYVYHDWQNNGALDLARAIQQSSDVYFYEVGGGYQDQPGMGIANIDKYATMFGYSTPISSNPNIFGSKNGTVPSPAWKAANFNGEQWLLGDTYHSVIGQYGWQVTPAQVVRAIAAVANDGTLLTPTIIAGDKTSMSTAKHINLPHSEFDVVHQGMRQSATLGTGAALNVDYTEFATKTGTAQTGANNETYNSWIVGFWPYDNPQYAFAFVMEHGPAGSLYGAPYVSRQIFDWMHTNTPEYFGGTSAQD